MNPLPAQVEMVADLYEIDAINEVTAAAILSRAADLSLGLAARLIGRELTERDLRTVARDRAAERAIRDDDGSWTP